MSPQEGHVVLSPNAGSKLVNQGVPTLEECADPVAIRKAHIQHETSVRGVAWLYYFVALLSDPSVANREDLPASLFKAGK